MTLVKLSERTSLLLALVLIVGAAAGLSMLRGRHPLDGEAAPAIELPIAAGQGADEGVRFSLAAQRGHVVLLDFWASWCPPCRRSIPILNQVHERYKDRGLVVMGVNTEQGLPPSRLRAAHRAFTAAFPSLADGDGRAGAAYAVESLPTLFVIDGEGRIAHVHVGVPDPDSLGRVVEDLLPD